MTQPEQEQFREVQHLWQNLIIRVMVPMSSLTVLAMVIAVGLKSPPSQQPIVFGVAGLVLLLDALMLFGFRLTTSVDERFVRVRFAPFPTTKVERRRILTADAVSFDPMSDMGGWGPKRSKKYGKCFTIAGDQGVLLTLDDGSMLLIGSRRHAELAALLNPGISSGL